MISRGSIVRALGGIEALAISRLFFSRVPLCGLLYALPARLLAQGWDMREGVTDIGQRFQTFHHAGLFVCLAVGIVVFGAMFYTIIAHRRSVHPASANFHDSAKIEVLWTLIPMFILVGVAVLAILTLRDIEDGDADVTAAANVLRSVFS